MTISFGKLGLRLPQTVISFLAIAVLLAGLAVVIQADSTYQRERAERAQVRAKILAFSATAAVDFGDSEAAREAVSAFRADPNARVAAVYDISGKLLGGYARQGQTAPQLLPSKASGSDASMETYTPVDRDGVRIGTVYLSSDSVPFYRRLTSSL